MSGKILKRALALCLCMLLLAAAARLRTASKILCLTH